MTTLKPYIILTVLCLLLYLPGIVVLPITDRDAAHFAQASKQMLETGNYWQVNFQNRPRHLKPPGIYWLHVLAVKVARVKTLDTVWPYRLPSVLGALLAVLLTFAMARRFVSEQVALLASGLLAASVLLVIEAHLIVTDAMLLFTMVLMQFGLWQCYQSDKDQTSCSSIAPLCFWLGMAAGLLIKGITPLVGVLTIIGICLIERRMSWLKMLKFSWGLPLFLGLTLVWLLPVSLIGNSDFLIDMIKGDVLPKLTGGQEHHGMPPGFFLAIFTLMFWPGSLFIWQGISYAWRHRQLASIRFLTAWIVPSWIFFEIVPTKLPQYVLPVYPAIAILVALGVLQCSWQSMPKTLRVLARIQFVIWTLFGLGLALGISLAAYGFWHKINYVSGLASGVLLVTMLLVWWSLAKTQWLRAAVSSIFGTALFMILLYQWVLPSWSPLWISQHVKILLVQRAPGSVNADQPLQAVGYNEPSLVFELGTHAVKMTTLSAAMEALHANHSQTLLITAEQKRALQHLLKRQHIKLQRLGVIHGFNYSRSKKVTVMVYQKEVTQ